MPSLDGGHYFFTALLPIDNSGIVERRGHGAFKSSPVHMVRDALEALPTALQSPASEEIGIPSPFSRSGRTHFVRLFVIDNPHSNGRDPEDSIVATASKADLLAAQPVDRLGCPYIVFIGDFDPAGDEPGAWLEELWTLAPRELCSVFEYCYGFDTGFDAAAFGKWAMRGQVETTMPFNDYWTTPPPFPSMPIWPLLIPPLLGLVVGSGLAALGGWPWWAGGALALALAATGVFFDVQTVMEVGARPLPAAPHASLRDVLKALYLQQAFARFAAAHQGQAPAQLRTAFAAFVAGTRPDDLDGPTQAPGVVRADLASGAL